MGPDHKALLPPQSSTHQLELDHRDLESLPFGNENCTPTLTEGALMVRSIVI
jgi:hypothetical protein